MPFIYLSTTPLLFIATLFVSSQCILEAHAKTFKKTWSNGRFTSSCAFELGGYDYNLCPLAGEAIHRLETEFANNVGDRQVQRTSGSRAMMVDLVNNRGMGQRVDNEQSSPEHKFLQCDNGSWNCLVDDISFFWRKIVLAQKNEVTVVIDRGINGDDSVYPHLHLLSKNIRRRGVSCADITLLCSSTTDIRSTSQQQETAYLQLSTPYACPQNSAAFAENAEDEEQEEKEGDDDLMPKRGVSTQRKLMIVALFVLGLPLVFGGILFSSRRARKFSINQVNGITSVLLSYVYKAAAMLRLIGSKINALNLKFKSPFRIGSDKLVVWAQEDMPLVDAEDVMVNGTGALDDDGWHADGFEEYILLSTNPRHGAYRHVRSYGATPLVENFAGNVRQERWLNRFGRFFRR